MKKKRTSEFKLEIGEVLEDNNRHLIVLEKKIIYKDRYNKNRGKTYATKEKCYRYICLKCGFDCSDYYRGGEYESELWVTESFLVTKRGGCACCCHNPQIVKPGINDITTTNPELIKYFQGGFNEAKKYTFRSNQEIHPICPDCNNIKAKPMTIDKIYENQGINCICDDGFSFGHKYIFSMLKQLNIEFSDNVRFVWCKYKMKNKIKQGEYDFVIEDKKLIIEVDGYFHRNDNQLNGTTKEVAKFIDSEKDRLAKEHGYNIIRIAYEHRDKASLNKTILSSDICSYFNLDKVSWNECFEYALSNISKVVADYWNNKEEWETTTDLVNHFGLCRKTISIYLKTWSDLGYCTYDSELESKKRYEKVKLINIERCSKPVEVYKDGVLLTIFKSLAEMEKSSERYLGVKLQRSNAIKVIRGERKHHKGFTFRYVENVD